MLQNQDSLDFDPLPIEIMCAADHNIKFSQNKQIQPIADKIEDDYLGSSYALLNEKRLLTVSPFKRKKACRIWVKIIEAERFQPIINCPPASHACEVSVTSVQPYRTAIIKKNDSPQFNDQCVFQVNDPSSYVFLRVVLCEEQEKVGAFKTSSVLVPIGENVMDLKEFFAPNPKKSTELWLDIKTKTCYVGKVRIVIWQSDLFAKK